MPYLIKTIDALSREKQRDVLWIRFHDGTHDFEHAFTDYETGARKTVLDFLEKRGIPWQACYPIFGEGVVEYPYEGDIYVDIPFDPGNPDYQTLAAFLEKDPSGTQTIDGAWFCVSTYEIAKQYAYRDEPGYWDNL